MARAANGQVVERASGRGTTYALRFRAEGRRHFVTLGARDDGWTRERADTELQNILADIRRGIWKPVSRVPTAAGLDPTFHEFASEWLASRRHELAPRTVEDYMLALTHHLLPFFAKHRLSEITAREVDRYKASKLRAREQVLSTVRCRTAPSTSTWFGSVRSLKRPCATNSSRSTRSRLT